MFRGTLVGRVGPGGALTLSDRGKPVQSLPPGRYKVSVTDLSKVAGFTIQEIRRSPTTVSAVSFVGKRAVTLTLAIGQWFYYPTFVGKKTYFIVAA